MLTNYFSFIIFFIAYFSFFYLSFWISEKNDFQNSKNKIIKFISNPLTICIVFPFISYLFVILFK